MQTLGVHVEAMRRISNDGCDQEASTHDLWGDESAGVASVEVLVHRIHGGRLQSDNSSGGWEQSLMSCEMRARSKRCLVPVGRACINATCDGSPSLKPQGASTNVWRVSQTECLKMPKGSLWDLFEATRLGRAGRSSWLCF